MISRPLKETYPLAAWLIDRFWWIQQPTLRMLYIWAVRWSVVAPIFLARESAAIGIERRSIVENALVPALVNSPCMVWRICRRGLGTEHAWCRDVARVVASGFPLVPVLLALLLIGTAIWSAYHPTEGMTLAAFSVPFIEVQTGGDDTNNGGLFETNGPTFPADGAATSATGATPLFSSASYNFVNGDINHWVFIKSGTNWVAGWYKITAVSSNKATLDAAVGHAPLFLSANTRAASLNNAAGCATTASPTSATWGLDYSQGTTARFTSTHFSSDATNTHLLDADNTIGKNWVGNSVVITAAGTGFTLQRLAILSTSGTTATCDKSVGGTNLSGGGGGMGGCLASPAMASSLGTANTVVWVKSGSYSITTATTNVSGGCISSTNGFLRFEAYSTIRGDRAALATLTSTVTTATLFLVNAGASSQQVRGIVCDGAGLSSVRCFDITQGSGSWLDCAALNGTNGGFVFANGNLTGVNMVAKNITGSNAFSCGLGSNFLVHSAVVSCTVAGFTFSINTGNSCVGCIAANNTGASSDGFDSNSSSWLVNCTAYANGRDGFRGNNTNNRLLWLNCVAEGNVGNGFNDSTSSPFAFNVFARYCATYNNGTAYSNTFSPITDHCIAYTSTAFVNAAGNNFALNNVPTGGGMLRAAGFPGTFGGSIGSTGFTDIGAVPAPHSEGFFIQ